jgi:hypothetical protein
MFSRLPRSRGRKVTFFCPRVELMVCEAELVSLREAMMMRLEECWQAMAREAW